jgi:hypothetical protein
MAALPPLSAATKRDLDALLRLWGAGAGDEAGGVGASGSGGMPAALALAMPPLPPADGRGLMSEPAAGWLADFVRGAECAPAAAPPAPPAAAHAAASRCLDATHEGGCTRCVVHTMRVGGPRPPTVPPLFCRMRMCAAGAPGRARTRRAARRDAA